MNALYNYSVRETDKLLEVVVRDVDGQYLLEIRTGVNEVGLLFRLCAVLLAYDCDISAATIHTANDHVRDEFRVRRNVPLSAEAIKSLVSDLRILLFDGLSVLEYLTNTGIQIEPREKQGGEVTVEAGEQPLILVTTTDQPGLMTALTQAFYLMDIDVQEADIRTLDDGRVRNRFVVSESDERFTQAAFCRRLSEELKTLL